MVFLYDVLKQTELVIFVLILNATVFLEIVDESSLFELVGLNNRIVPVHILNILFLLFNNIAIVLKRGYLRHQNGVEIWCYLQ